MAASTPPCTSSWALSLLDLSYATTTVPQMLIHLVSKSKTISYVGCVIRCMFSLTLGITDLGFLQLWPMTDMLPYATHSIMGSRWAKPLCVLLAVSSLPFVVSPCALVYTVFAMNLPYCGPQWDQPLLCEILLSWSWLVQIHPSMTKWTYLGLYLAPDSISFILPPYVCIFTAISKDSPPI